MSENIQYSILMSVYYKEKAQWLKSSIESILCQTLKPAELVVIKDGELTDELESVLAEFKNKNQELFSVYGLKENVGLGRALAFGIQKCKHNLVIRMDSDDISDKNRCEKLIKRYCENPDLDIVGSWESEFEDRIDKTCAVHKVPETNEQICEFMKKRCAILHPTVLYQKKSVLAAGNYRDVKLYEDYDLFMRMVLEHGMKACNIQEPLYHIRINDDFYKRRGGTDYMKVVLAFKWRQYQKGYLELHDFMISAGGQAMVCLLPNFLRKKFYMKFLRR